MNINNENIFEALLNVHRFDITLDTIGNIEKAIVNTIYINEVYYNALLNNYQISKEEIYENIILKKNNSKYASYLAFIKKNQSLLELDKETNINFFEEIIANHKVTYNENTLQKIINLKNDEQHNIITRMAFIYSMFYKYKPFSSYNNEMANVLNSAIIAKKYGFKNNLYLSEVIYHNSETFDAKIYQLSREKNNEFINLYALMVAKQFERNILRVKRTIELSNETLAKLEKLDIKQKQISKINQFIMENPIFTITQYHEEINVAYNTAKSQLKTLVEAEILEPTKISKNNGYRYRGFLTIWQTS